MFGKYSTLFFSLLWGEMQFYLYVSLSYGGVDVVVNGSGSVGGSGGGCSCGV